MGTIDFLQDVPKKNKLTVMLLNPCHDVTLNKFPAFLHIAF
jgi:hypothetical protein